MIAHRLNTIESADNLLYIESPKNVIAASKRETPDLYAQLIQKLKDTSYKH